MNLGDVVRRGTLAAWAEEEKIPWNEPGFSARMLREHLTQAHGRASRRFEAIDGHVEWVHRAVLGGRQTRILDLGCGPGLYATRLARLGHRCVGIDFSPASIRHARGEAEREGLACTFHERDLRDGDYGEGFGLALLVFGELNAFRTREAADILAAARTALEPGAALVLELHTRAALEREEPPSWYAAESGLFSDRPHLCLRESAWDTASRARVERYYVLDAASGGVERYGITTRAYEPDEYLELLHGAGFARVELHPALDGADPDDLFVLVAR